MKYAGYIERERKEAQKMDQVENQKIPLTFDYHSIVGLRNEAREKLLQFQPETVGQATRISGVSPADISILIVALQRKH